MLLAWLETNVIISSFGSLVNGFLRIIAAICSDSTQKLGDSRLIRNDADGLTSDSVHLKGLKAGSFGGILTRP